MKYLKISLIFAALLAFMSCEDDFLDKKPIDQMTDGNFWTSEENVRTFSLGFYQHFFIGYGEGWTWGDYFSGQSLNDDFAPSNPPQWTKNVPTSGGGWDFTYVRKANLFLDRIQQVPMEEEAINHWTGVARFFRGLEYARLVQRFGDVPWFDYVPEPEEKDYLYKPRDPRTFVMEKVLEDFRFAAENVRDEDGVNGLSVNRAVVLAFMSRMMLWEGTFQKYHEVPNSNVQELLEAAKWAANEIITNFDYQIVPDYHGIFSSMDLADNKEVILYRSYVEGVLTHCLVSYVNQEAQTGASKDLIESYLCSDGLPVSLSSVYQGDDGIDNVMANRDPRMYDTFVEDTLRINGVVSNYSTTGYACDKFLNYDIMDEPIATNAYNPTDAPVIRYGEVLVNYAEACAELGTLTQADLDKSINKLRQRYENGLPDLQVIGGEPAVNGVVYDDPERDPEVPSMIWEIRRERRTELVFEGYRLGDLKRWKKLEYTDTKENVDINRGAYIRAADYPGMKNVILEGGDEGYIIPAVAEETQRPFTDPRVYLDPLPLDQITLYEDNGYTLEQNPGWESE
ncbi:RagB/SusD family nutrient uptake outer membrane protein [Anaerophaga thermohalophila]|uniref:RagB/SusD family nutrient uptake outer membrane protein n=1 Tax=Anaerophaga thermohalophila TaxID=177400 RepID=UPI000315C008|nr:RagB/SusD family nutrient uptake outer membrane protein [Anaerophaga thermohalophila]